MRRLFRHIILFAAINGFLVAIWMLLTGGSVEMLQRVIDSPSESWSLGFWPIWPLLGWGTLLLIHVGMVVSNLPLGGRSKPSSERRAREKERRRRRREAEEAKASAKELAKGAGEVGTQVVQAGAQIVRQVAGAIDRAHEKRLESKDEPPGVAAALQASSGRRWVTVMFCDIASSTTHNERLGDEEWARILSQVRGVVRGALAERGGTEVGTQGDGMLARFGSPPDAVMCGVDIQSELGQARKASAFVPEVRLGIHAGEVVEDEGDLVGRVINLASRVMGEAEPGEILVTEPVADQLVGKLELEDRGLRELKGLSQPRHLLAVRWGGPGE